jgi:hypothetical protein
VQVDDASSTQHAEGELRATAEPGAVLRIDAADPDDVVGRSNVLVDQHRGTAGVTTEVDEPPLVVVQVNPATSPGDVAQFLAQRRRRASGGCRPYGPEH